MSEKMEINIFESELVPKHEILSEEEKAQLLKDFDIKLQQLPRIREDDPVAAALKAKKEDVIRVKRKSPVGGEYNYYRVVFGEIKK